MDMRIVLEQMAMLFMMMAVGFFVWKRGWLTEHSYQQFSKIIVNIFNPMLVLYGVMDKNSEGNAQLILQNLRLVFVFYGMLFLFGFAAVWILRPKIAEKNLYRLMALFPNVGFMGIPVITSILGNDVMIYVVFYILFYNLLLYSFGIRLACQAAAAKDPQKAPDGGRGNWKRMINPGSVAAVTALIIFLCQITVPAPIVGFCDYFGNATTPLSMMMIGISIARADLRKIFANRRMYLFVFLRMFLLPAGAVLIARQFPLDPMILGVFALQLAMPVGSILTLLAKENGADETCCTNGIVLSTILSMVSIPLICVVL